MAPEPSLRYLLRIIKVLSEHQEIGISNLASKARMNHKRCADIVGGMQHKGYLSVTMQNGKKTIKVTEQGMQYIKRISSAPLPN